MEHPEQVLLIGYGAIAKPLVEHLPKAVLCGVLLRPGSPSQAAAAGDRVRIFDSLDQALAEPFAIAVECAGADALRELGSAVLRTGHTLIAASVGALAEDALRERLIDAARRGRSRLIVPAGAVAGIDGLAAARFAGLHRVVYTGSKPPRAWLNTPAEAVCDLGQIEVPTVVFEGSARDAARLFPKNANVTATIALAGIGLDRTKTTLMAVPHLEANIHEVEAEGSFGALKVLVSNNPSKDNPRTSALVALSILRILHDRDALLSL
jgi:aspartate dehydrogenase